MKGGKERKKKGKERGKKEKKKRTKKNEVHSARVISTHKGVN